MAAEDGRWFVRDHKPYAVPASLEALTGPAAGQVMLPLSVYWAAERTSVDVGNAQGAFKAYVALLSEGTLEDVVSLVNAERLKQVWNQLLLPVRCAAEWERRFPELTRAEARAV